MKTQRRAIVSHFHLDISFKIMQTESVSSPMHIAYVSPNEKIVISFFW